MKQYVRLSCCFSTFGNSEVYDYTSLVDRTLREPKTMRSIQMRRERIHSCLRNVQEQSVPLNLSLNCLHIDFNHFTYGKSPFLLLCILLYLKFYIYLSPWLDYVLTETWHEVCSPWDFLIPSTGWAPCVCLLIKRLGNWISENKKHDKNFIWLNNQVLYGSLIGAELGTSYFTYIRLNLHNNSES